MSKLPTLYAKFKKELGVQFVIEDWIAVDIIIAVPVAHYTATGESLWLRVIDASRSGKTELLRCVIAYPDVREVEVITPAALRGGLKGGAKVLDRIKGHVVVTKDLAALLSSRREVKNEIFGLLRNIKDGRLVSDYGTEEGNVCQEGIFDWIIAVTPIIEQQRQFENLLGARFVDLRWITADREKMADKAIENNPRLSSIRAKLADLMKELLECAKNQGSSYSPRLGIHWIARVADQAALCRSPVQRDTRHHPIAMPNPEIGTELAQGFSRIAAGLLALGIENYKPYIWRLFADAIPDIRRRVLKELVNETATTGAGIALKIGLSEAMIGYHLEDIKLLGIDLSKLRELRESVETPLEVKGEANVF